MKKEDAIQIQELALKAIKELNLIFGLASDYEEYASIKKGIGVSIGYIDANILGVIYKQFPELDHIKEPKN